MPAIVFGVVVALLVVAVVLTRAGERGGADQAKAGASVAQTRAVTVSGAALSTLGSSGSDPAVGTVAPTVTGTTFDGRPVQVGGTGRPALVLFVAHWCPHCQREVPLLAPELGRITPPGVDFLAVSTSVRDGGNNYPPSAWLEKQEWPRPVLADDEDGSAAKAYGLSGFPYYVVLGGDGKVVARDSGEKTVAEVEALLREASSPS